MQNDGATIHTHREQVHAMIVSNWRATDDDEVANHL